MAPPPDKRSLREIQEEEHALQAEADFLIWWTAEEERVQQEAEAEAWALVESQNNHHTPSSAPPPPPRRSSRNPRHKSDKKDRGESGAKASVGASAGPSSTGSGQASMMQRVPSTGESSGSAGRQPTVPPSTGTESRANHSPRKQQPRKPRPKSAADS